jgi:hypothetical protein
VTFFNEDKDISVNTEATTLTQDELLLKFPITTMRPSRFMVAKTTPTPQMTVTNILRIPTSRKTSTRNPSTIKSNFATAKRENSTDATRKFSKNGNLMMRDEDEVSRKSNAKNVTNYELKVPQTNLNVTDTNETVFYLFLLLLHVHL